MRAVTISEPLPTGSGAALWAEAAPATASRLTEAINAAVVFIGAIPDIRRVGRGPGFDVIMTLRLLASLRLDPAQATETSSISSKKNPLRPAPKGIFRLSVR
ncbi:hypothetical protein GCM10009434_12510 [Brevundimonas olei]